MNRVKIHRLDLSGTGSSEDFIVRIPDTTCYQGQLFIEAISVDSNTDATNDINGLHIRSKTIYDAKSYNSDGTSNNLIGHIPNNISVNTNKDIRFAQLINQTDIGFQIKSIDLSNWNFNITIEEDNGTPIPETWTWHLQLLILDYGKPNNLIQNDKTQAGYLNGPHPQTILAEGGANPPDIL